MLETDMAEIASCIDAVLGAIGTPDLDAVIAATKVRVQALTGRFPLPYKM